LWLKKDGGRVLQRRSIPIAEIPKKHSIRSQARTYIIEINRKRSTTDCLIGSKASLQLRAQGKRRQKNKCRQNKGIDPLKKRKNKGHEGSAGSLVYTDIRIKVSVERLIITFNVQYIK
jgi:hypothetical protein